MPLAFMFKTLVKQIFKASKTTKPNLYYFEESRIKDKEEAKPAFQAKNIQAIENKPLRYFSFEDEYQYAFYDYLFGPTPNENHLPHDELAENISEKINSLLTNPKLILDALPILPLSLTKVLEQLNNNEFDTDLVVKLVQQEPAIAAKVIELANSSYYNRHNKEITDLKSAFLVLGVDGLSEGVINGFISKLVPQSSIYFRQYGQKIWQHSLATGINAKALISNTSLSTDAAKAYFIGLISNLGDVIIYQLMIDAFSVVHPDCQPNSALFKELMSKHSKKLTYFIAKFWNFPNSILEVLAIQTKVKKAALLPALHKKMPIACYIHEAKVISEMKERLAHEPIKRVYIDEVSTSLLHTKEAKEYLKTIITDNDLYKAE